MGVNIGATSLLLAQRRNRRPGCIPLALQPGDFLVCRYFFGSQLRIFFLQHSNMLLQQPLRFRVAALGCWA